MPTRTPTLRSSPAAPRAPRRGAGRPAATAVRDHREALIDAARDEFAAHGFAATSLRRVAQAARVTPALANYYFGDKAGLLEAVLEGRVAPIVRELGTAVAAAGTDPRAPWWRRLLSRFVEVRPSAGVHLQAPADRSAGRDALRIELTIARAALERRDAAAWRDALERANAWLPRLWPDSPALRTRRQELRDLRALPLKPSLPVLGSTLEQLRSRRAAR